LLRVKQAKNLSFDDNQLQNFKGSLESLLVLRYRSHWYPELPHKGSGYRCIRINGKMDPLVEQAGVAVGLPPRQLRKMLPPELTLWIDPEEVAYRIGENGSICVLYDSQSRASPSSDLDSTGSASGLSGDEFIMERVGRLDVSGDYLDRSPSSSTNSSPTKPTNQFGHFVGNNDSPPLSPPYRNGGATKYYPQPQPQQNLLLHRQHINGNSASNHHQQQQQFYQQQNHAGGNSHLYHWDGFGNTNKVLCG